MDRNFTDVLEPRIDTKQARESLAELSASVEKLYQVFASYNLNPELDRCTDCVTMEDELRVYSKPHWSSIASPQPHIVLPLQAYQCLYLLGF